METDHQKIDAIDKRLTALEATLPLQIEHLTKAIEDFRKDMGGKLSELSISIKEQTGFNEMFRGHVSQQANINERVNQNSRDIEKHKEEDDFFHKKVLRIMYIGYGIIIAITFLLNYPQFIKLLT